MILPIRSFMACRCMPGCAGSCRSATQALCHHDPAANQRAGRVRLAFDRPRKKAVHIPAQTKDEYISPYNVVGFAEGGKTIVAYDAKRLFFPSRLMRSKMRQIRSNESFQSIFSPITNSSGASRAFTAFSFSARELLAKLLQLVFLLGQLFYVAGVERAVAVELGEVLADAGLFGFDGMDFRFGQQHVGM